MRKRMAIGLFILGVIFVTSGRPALSADEPDAVNGTFIVRGRFLGLALFSDTRQKNPDHALVKAQILIEKNYSYFGKDFLGKIYQLDTGKRLKYQDIEEASFPNTIKSYLPTGIKRGQSVLVIGRLDVKKRRGFLLEEIHAYTADAETALLKKNASMIKKQKQWFLKQHLKMYQDRIKSHTEIIGNFRKDMEKSTADHRARLEKQINVLEESVKADKDKVRELEKELQVIPNKPMNADK